VTDGHGNGGGARADTPQARRMRLTFGVVSGLITFGAMFLFGPPGWMFSYAMGAVGAGVAGWWAVGVAIRRRGS
jgi:hypothetical protein